MTTLDLLIVCVTVLALGALVSAALAPHTGRKHPFAAGDSVVLTLDGAQVSGKVVSTSDGVLLADATVIVDGREQPARGRFHVPDYVIAQVT